MEEISFLAMANSEAGTSSDAARALGGEYDVFLSFRGADTRHVFTDFLYHGLVDAGAQVFRDEDELSEGEVISENLLKAINSSKLYIPIFSHTYASSKWCLRELALIVENVSKSEGQKSILPIFLDVEPEDVKLKTPLYNAAFKKHKKNFPNEVEAWKRALGEVDEIKGWNVKKDQGQATIVKSVVEKVLEKLEMKQKPVTEYLVGFDDPVKELIELLDVNNRDVRLIGIYGMGGIGKTTIAKVVFNQLSSHFGKRCSFLENVRESSSTKEGIFQLQVKLLCDVGLRWGISMVNSEQGIRRIEEALPTKKILVVLDDVDNKYHIKKLIGNSLLHSGSRIIITTRNTSTLEVEEFNGKVIPYEMLEMDNDFALKLFCRHAFGRDSPSDDYCWLSSEIVSRTGGLPLAIKVIGSLLKGKDEEFWKETMATIREIPDEEILEKLRISYDDLEEDQKQIFLDIACFLVNEKKTDAIYMWVDCKFRPNRGIRVLVERCLIKILDNDRFWMHDQLIDLGRQIVRQESPSDLGKRSRLWIAKEALEIIRTEERKDKVQALQIDGLDDSIEITNEEFERLQNLKFLKLRNGTYAGDFAKSHSKLTWISWHPPHQDFRADNMYLDHLVVFKLGMNGFTDDSKAWDLIKRAQNLKVLSLTKCDGITKFPNFSRYLGLERLTLEGCKNLKRIESFIGDLRLLIELEIIWCMNLAHLPEEVGALTKLKRFSLKGCRLRNLPDSIGNLTSLIELDLSRTSIVELPDSIRGLVKLESFLLKGTMLRKLPNSIGKLKALRKLDLSKTGSNTPKDHVWLLPREIGMLENLKELDLSGRHEMKGEISVAIGKLSSLRILNLECTRICGIPRTINQLHLLQMLNLTNCHEMQGLPELPTSLTCLLLESRSLLSVPNLSNLTNLVELRLSDHSGGVDKSNLITGCNLTWIGRLARLKKLDLNLMNVPAPPELASLSHLEQLYLAHLDLETLVQLPSALLRLHFSRNMGPKLLPSCLRLRNLSTLNIYHSRVEDIPLDGLPQLEKLIIGSCERLQTLSIPLELRKLRKARLSNCPELIEIQVVGVLKLLESFFVCVCKSLRIIGGLSYLKNLEQLEIRCCYLLTNVEGLNELESLKFLEFIQCRSLRRLIDASCTNIPNDCLVHIEECGDFIRDSTRCDPRGISLKHYKEEILLDTSNFEPKSDKKEHPFTIIFHVVKYSTEEFEFVDLIKREKEYVTLDSVTYKGLIADVKGFGFRSKRMWHKNSDTYDKRVENIESDKQVKEMVQLASNRGWFHLYVEGEVDSELGNSECFEATGNRRQMRDGRIGHDGNVDGGKTASMEDRKMDKDEIGESANQNDVVWSICQRGVGVEHDERSCKATTEVEDQRDLSSRDDGEDDDSKDDEDDDVQKILQSSRWPPLVYSVDDCDVDEEGNGNNHDDNKEEEENDDEEAKEETINGSNQETGNVPAKKDVIGVTRVASCSRRGTASHSGVAFDSGSGRGSSSHNGFNFRKRFMKFKIPACFRRS